jgi:hypothetical protein
MNNFIIALLREGDTIQLACDTNAPWQLCSWRSPDGNWCDRLSTNRYATGCNGRERISYQVWQLLLYANYLHIVVCWWRTTATRSATADGRNVRTLGIP